MQSLMSFDVFLKRCKKVIRCPSQVPRPKSHVKNYKTCDLRRGTLIPDQIKSAQYLHQLPL